MSMEKRQVMGVESADTLYIAVLERDVRTGYGQQECQEAYTMT